ncbi:MAG: Fic family protein [Planctomycetaceae bacterium]|nr:Fic family protein [Planctomycetaceae bacterium]
MNKPVFQERKTRPVGYSALIHRFKLDVVPHWRRSYVTNESLPKTHTMDGVTEVFYPAKYWPGETLGDHLEFALKYDGTNLALLAAIFQSAPKSEFESYIASKPRGKYARRLWFFYEMLTETQLDLHDLQTGGYVDLLEPDEYYTVSPPEQVRRQRVNDNLPGNRQFCPTVRRTETLKKFEGVNLTERCREIVAAYSPQLLKRAMGYLYTKETRSSFAIENIEPNSTRAERFVALLHAAKSDDYCEKSRLLELQNRIVDPRFQCSDYRNTQNYVGEMISWQREKIHYVGPKPDDLSELMEGLIASHQRMNQSDIHAVAHAAMVSYGFVFLHPLEDGNGRIHRFLIHNILARRNFTPSGMIFPVSASMLRNRDDYDASLEAFSRPIMELVEYRLDDEGRLTVQNDTACWYRYIDLTVQTEMLFRFIEQTIETELVDELTFLVSYDQAKKAIQEIVDMPDRKIDLFIRLCLQNNGRLSKSKRGSLFDFLSDAEIARMEEAIRFVAGNEDHFQLKP